MIAGRKNDLRIGCVGTIIALVCLYGNVSCKQSDQPAVGQELSGVDGVSLVRVHATNSRSVSSGGSNDGAHIEAEGIDLVSCIGSASGNRDPIIFLTNLPLGQYRVAASVNQGGQQELTKKICYTFSKAFDRSVTRRMIETEVVVLTCPDPNSLKIFKDSTQQSRGFYRHDELGSNRMRTHFGATLDQLAWYAGYISRNTAAQNDIENRCQQLKIAYVNETHLEGIYSGAIEWAALDPDITKASLTDMGFTLTTVKRTIPAIVVELPSKGQQWVYLNEEGEQETVDPNQGVDHARESGSIIPAVR